ncbi:MAG TPA: acyltransferase domain-containing protein [Burkholderiaceae bacterium]|jgi:[acyl-carrier-protein] S-malonyltransferase|nr:acyltransferase domain-containing protein [Burkholderiaceae bacterium]
MSFALVFSGQGTQHPAMLPWLDEDAIVRSMGTRLGVREWRVALADAAWAERNANAQTLLTGLALSAWHQIAPSLPPPSTVAGYSVGELAAFSAAGVFDAETALDLARRRAEAMDRCAAHTPGGLLAVSGFGSEAIDRLCARTGLAIAIRNGPDSVVLGGPHAALDLAERALAAQSVRRTRLRVGVASHTPWMRDAAQDFLQTLSQVSFDKPHTLLFSNAADRIRDDAGARHALAAQIASTVRWDECMENIRARQVACVLEIGPGQALARLWNERYPDVPARSCDEFRSAAGVAKWVASNKI